MQPFANTPDDLKPLRALVAPLAIDFGVRLLSKVEPNQPVAFRHFRAVAAEMVANAPDAAAAYLACLVAFDIRADADRSELPPPAPRKPGRN